MINFKATNFFILGMNLRVYVKLLQDHSGMYELTQCHPTFLLLVVDMAVGSCRGKSWEDKAIAGPMVYFEER